MTAKSNTDQFKKMSFMNIRPTDFARLRNKARIVQEQFDETKKTMFRHGEERLASAPKIMDYLDAKGAVSGYQQGAGVDENWEKTGGDDYQDVANTALKSSWDLGRDVSNTIQRGRDAYRTAALARGDFSAT